MSVSHSQRIRAQEPLCVRLHPHIFTFTIPKRTSLVPSELKDLSWFFFHSSFAPESSVNPLSPSATEVAASKLAKGKGRAEHLGFINAASTSFTSSLAPPVPFVSTTPTYSPGPERASNGFHSAVPAVATSVGLSRPFQPKRTVRTSTSSIGLKKFVFVDDSESEPQQPPIGPSYHAHRPTAVASSSHPAPRSTRHFLPGVKPATSPLWSAFNSSPHQHPEGTMPLPLPNRHASRRMASSATPRAGPSSYTHPRTDAFETLDDYDNPDFASFDQRESYGREDFEASMSRASSPPPTTAYSGIARSSAQAHRLSASHRSRLNDNPTITSNLIADSQPPTYVSTASTSCNRDPSFASSSATQHQHGAIITGRFTRQDDRFLRKVAADLPLTQSTQPWKHLLALYGDEGKVNHRLAGR